MRPPARQQQQRRASTRSSTAAAKSKPARTKSKNTESDTINQSSNGSNAGSSSSSIKENNFTSSSDALKQRGRPRRSGTADAAAEADNMPPRKKARLSKAATASSNSSSPEAAAGRRNIKRIMKAKDISTATKVAEAAERERLRRIAERQKQQEQKQQQQQQQRRRRMVKEEEEEADESEEEKQGAADNETAKVINHAESVSPLSKNRRSRSRSRPRTSQSPESPPTPPLVLEREPDNGAPLVDVAPRICRHLKPHQSEAVQFLYDCLYESVDEARRGSHGSGALLAHCMGLGKTLSVIAFLHAVMRRANPQKAPLGARSVLIVCPLNVALNWANEFRLWLGNEAAQRRCGETPLPVCELTSLRLAKDRLAACRNFKESGGILIVNYDLFRNLVQGRGLAAKRKQRELYRQALLDPGPDIVVCDEGHILKSSATGLAKAMSQVRTRRRIVLTGTPLQNNLMEYYTMVSFVKPNLLGTQKEFANRFVNPINNGQHSDSTAADVRLMKHRSHVLHGMLAGCVHRRDYTALTRYLPPKHEFIINVRLGEEQEQMYRKYLDQVRPLLFSNSVSLFADQQVLYRVWTHPHLLKLHEDEVAKRGDRWTDNEDDDDTDEEECEDCSDENDEATVDEDENGDENADEDPGQRQEGRQQRLRQQQQQSRSWLDSDSAASADEVITGWTTRRRRGVATSDNDDDDGNGVAPTAPTPRPPQWWHPLYTDTMAEDVSLSGKLHILFSLLRSFDEHGDKTLVFSQSLLSLDIIEHFLGKLSDSEAGETWTDGEDYLRLDGSTPAASRKAMSEAFNVESDRRLRLFLISTKAGGLGVNLPAANRVIIFDVSWNPSHDIQSIFRTYRFGQTKTVYVYRLVAQGTMEEKIYSRQVNKQSLGFRVIDEHQINRHFTAADLVQLYTLSVDRFDPLSDARKKFDLPVDDVLADLLAKEARWISSYHLHDSLLENIESELLTDEERQQAWREYEEEKTARPRIKQLQQQQQQLEQLSLMAIAVENGDNSGSSSGVNNRSSNAPMPYKIVSCPTKPPTAALGHSASAANLLGAATSARPTSAAASMPRVASSVAVLQQQKPASSTEEQQQQQQQLEQFRQLRHQYPLQYFNIRSQVLSQRPDLKDKPADLNRLACTYLLDWLRSQQEQQEQRRQERQQQRQQLQQKASEPITIDDD